MGRSSLDLRKHFFPEKIVRHWNRSPAEVARPPSLGVFKRCTDVELGNMVQWWTWQSQVSGWTC